MEPQAPAAKTDWNAAFRQKRSPKLIAGSLALGVALSGLGWQFYLKPIRAIAEKRIQTQKAMIRLYDLQMTFRGAHGTFANDPETLINSAPDASALREQLKANADYSTLTVVGDAEKFKLESNVLDPERTAIKIRGPFPTSTPKPVEREALPEPVQTP